MNASNPMFSRFIANVATMRRRVLDLISGGTTPARDLYKECGYSENPSATDLLDMFQRELGGRVVDVVPTEAWRLGCELRETEDEDLTDFESAWNKLEKKHNLWHFLERGDVMSGVGSMGVLLLGFDDGKPLDQPVEGVEEFEYSDTAPSQERKLLFIRVFDETLATISEFETDEQNPRYGMPKLYELTFDAISPTASHVGPGRESQKKQVHWTRVVHLADNRTTSELFGLPRQYPVWNRLWDIRKIMGGSGEGYWQASTPGLSLETHPSQLASDVEIDMDATKEQMAEYVDGLRRFLVLDQMSAKTLAPNIPAPDAFVKAHIQLMCATLKVPYRVFVGSEAASMASTQDLTTWYGRMNGRNLHYTGPLVVKPFVRRLIAAGVLPVPMGDDGGSLGEFDVVFEDLNAPKRADRIEMAARMTEALARYVQAGVESVMPLQEYLTKVFDYTDDEAASLVEAAEERIAEIEEEQAALEEAVQAELDAQQASQPPAPPQTTRTPPSSSPGATTRPR